MVSRGSSAVSTGAVPAGLPLAALVLARRVRALVAATVIHTMVLAVATWWTGGGPTLPGVAALAAHLAVSLGAALPVRWQFAGDPARRERRAVRAMTVSFVVLAVYSAVDAVTLALAPGRPAGALVGAALGLAAAVALPLLVAADSRAERADRDPDARGPVPRVLVVALVAVLLAASVVDLVAGAGAVPSVAAPAVSAVVAVLAAREALGAWRG
ncbi:hypothetical protein [Actinomycetospora cinnamomea]|uniref:Uncharacterized protein n=1 Tax=Actinomycetospora cinnamomea TaxID=663609 RepID=A0A2U1EWC7_9PSEU|nr:hypothetical protein [Actinomycetospora cinnamomea]PVZ04234.1 hypothetical protein C8D89_11822 [Actinomycetospora cinnamomea]